MAEEAHQLIYGDTVIIETDVNDEMSAVLSRVQLVPLDEEMEDNYGDDAEWLLLSAEGEEDQTCQPIEYGENVRLIHSATDKRLHYDGADFSLWANRDGSGDTNDNWTVLDGAAQSSGEDWFVGAPFMLKHVVTGMLLGGNGVVLDPLADPPRRFSVIEVL